MSRSQHFNSDGWAAAFSQIDPYHRFELLLLLATAMAVTSIGAFSILQFLMEYSDDYASRWWLAIPLLVIPFGGGVALEQLLAKIENEKARNRTEKIVGVIAILSFWAWLAGLLDMANVGGYGEESSFFKLPNGTRVVSQILFEVTTIALIASRGFYIIKGHWPDGHLPGAEKAALMREIASYEENVLRPLQNQIDSIKTWIPPLEGERVKFVLRESAEFLAICAEYDAYKLQLKDD